MTKGFITIATGKEEKTYTLKITFVNLFGKKVGTATITKTGDGLCVISATEIRAAAPAGRTAIWMIPIRLPAGSNGNVIIPVI